MGTVEGLEGWLGARSCCYCRSASEEQTQVSGWTKGTPEVREKVDALNELKSKQ